MASAGLFLGRVLVGALDARSVASRQEGQALIEYALIISLIAVVGIATLRLTGTNISKILNTIAGEV